MDDVYFPFSAPTTEEASLSLLLLLLFLHTVVSSFVEERRGYSSRLDVPVAARNSHPSIMRAS